MNVLAETRQLNDEIAATQIEEILSDTRWTIDHPMRVYDGETLEARVTQVIRGAKERGVELDHNELRTFFAQQLFERTAPYPGNVPPKLEAHLATKGLTREMFMSD